MSYLKSPMILIAIAGMGMMVGMPYLLDSSTSSAFFYHYIHSHSPDLSPSLRRH